MKINTQDLLGPALDWAVAAADNYTKEIRFNRFNEWEDLGRTQVHDDAYTIYSPSTDWSQGGPIIEREQIRLSPPFVTVDGDAVPTWGAYIRTIAGQVGPTPLIAAMRCYVASKLGDEVDVPEESL